MPLPILKYLFVDMFILENYKLQDIHCIPLGMAFHKMANLRSLRLINTQTGDKGLAFLLHQFFLPF